MELIVTEVRARDIAAVIVTHDQGRTRYADRTSEYDRWRPLWGTQVVT